MKRSILAGALVAIGLLAGCENESPTSTAEELIPLEAQSVEVRVPFATFGTDFRLLSGFGSAVELNQGLLARAYRDTLDARTLSRFPAFPEAAAVRDTTGAVVADSSLTFIGGRVVARFDTTSPPGVPVKIRAGAIQTVWHARTVTWELAVDTVGRRELWPEPGGGPVTVLDSTTWDPAAADTAVFRVDSATIAAWSDSTDTTRGVRLSVETPGERIRIRTLDLRLRARPSANPDTIIEVRTAGPKDLTFIYTPQPDPPPDGMRIGGVPAWRTVFRIDVPETLTGPPELCEALGCPFEVTPGAVSFASLVVVTRQSPMGFQPDDTLSLDVRPVLSPERLPKAPLGNTLVGPGGRPLPPSFFSGNPGREINVPMTRYIRDVIAAGRTDEGEDVPSTVALLSTLEPVSLSLSSFHGPGSAQAPFLRLILTRDTGVDLP